jgi:hypothetical protein
VTEQITKVHDFRRRRAYGRSTSAFPAYFRSLPRGLARGKSGFSISGSQPTVQWPVPVFSFRFGSGTLKVSARYYRPASFEQIKRPMCVRSGERLRHREKRRVEVTNSDTDVGTRARRSHAPRRWHRDGASCLRQIETSALIAAPANAAARAAIR